MTQQDGKKIVSGSNMMIDRVSGRCSLHIRAVTGDDEAEYLCEASNEHGTASTVQQLLVNCIYSLVSIKSRVPPNKSNMFPFCMHILCQLFSAGVLL